MSQASQPLEVAPDFSLQSLQGDLISLASYAGRKWVVLWFSRGFTCPFCRSHMENISAGYSTLQAGGIEVIQIAPNLLASARTFFGDNLPPYPFLCDPDKTLYARYGLGDRGVLEATRNTFISFGHAAATRQFATTVRASWLDVANRNFIRRLHHHASTALEQGLFFVDPAGYIRRRHIVGALDPVPTSAELQRQLEESRE